MGESGNGVNNHMRGSDENHRIVRSPRGLDIGRILNKMHFTWTRRVAHLILAIIVVSFPDVQVSNAQGTAGAFVSIDCGSPAVYEDSKGIIWSTDSAYISTGQNAIIDTTPANLGSEHSQNVQKLRTLRSFPEIRKKHCYVIPEVQTSSLYLIRVMFLGANFTSAQGQNVSFGITVGNYYYGEITISDSFTPLTLELTFVTGKDPFSLCIVRAIGTPFISSLELRQLPSYYYQTTAVPFTAFKTIFRWDCGSASNASTVRYPSDPHDRLWGPSPPSFRFNTVSNFSAQIDNSSGDSSLYLPPTIVMQSAWTAPLTSSINFSWPLSKDTSDLILFMYFAEITSVSSNDVRELDAYLNGERSQPIVVTPTIVNSFNFLNTTLDISILPSKKSTLGAILNAVEAYSVLIFNNTYVTLAADVQAITVIQESLNLTDWMGDPCLPVPFDWIQCSSPNSTTVSRVLKIDLSSYNLSGTIPAEIAQLTELNYLSLGNNNLTGDISSLTFPETLETLQLQNNHLEGSIPNSLAALPNLQVLTLDNNMLSGNVPQGLLTKVRTNLLTFSASGNPNLCYGGNNVCPTVLTPAPSPSKSNVTGANTKTKSSSSVGIIIGAIAGVLAVLLVVGVLFYFCRRRTSAGKHASSDTAGKTPAFSQMEHSHQGKSFSFLEVKAATNNFAKVIGKGGFGVVYYGKLSDGQEVAVKVNKANARDGQGMEEFLNEVALLSRVHHRNLVSLVGYCDELDQQILIYVYMAEGTLREHLYGETRRGVPLDWKTRLDIAFNAARGLEYLHNSCSPPIIHRDVKSTNILLTHELLAKVADFGISKSTPENDRTRGITTQIKGTHGYLDPEYFMGHRLTTKSDVYSFGIVLLELVTGRKPNETIFPGATAKYLQDWVHESVRAGDIHAVIDPQMSANYNLESIWKVVELALLSLDQQGVRRPDMQEIVGGLTQALELQNHHIQTPTTYHSPSQLPPGSFDSYQRVHHASRGSRSSKDSVDTHFWDSHVTGR